MRTFLTRVLVPAGITLLGLVIVGIFFLVRPRADREPPAHRSPSVQVMEISPAARRAVVTVHGLVVPSREVTVVPEVGGRIVWQSERLIPGGRFDRGERLATIDQRDYRLAIQQEQGRVCQAELELQLEQERQGVARREWEILGDDRPPGEAALALREPHLVAARENLEAARASLARAELSLERTELRAPFDALVVDEQIDVGQVVGAGSPAATLIDASRFWIQASIPVEKLTLIDIPGIGADAGSPARVVRQVGGGRIGDHEGAVLRLLGELDAATRTGQLLIAIDDPLEAGDGEIPLLPGAFVEVEIEGREVDGAVAVPRAALVDGSRVWLVDDAGQLRSREVEIGWRTPEAVIVIGGLEAGERVVTTPPRQALSGMAVEVVAATAADAG